MTDAFTEVEVISIVARLTPARLAMFLDAELVMPVPVQDGRTFRRIDLARLELLCDLADSFDLDADALGIVISLIDQLHEARHRLRAVAEALDAEPKELQARVGARVIDLLTRYGQDP